MRTRYQQGTIQRSHRKHSADVWLFRYVDHQGVRRGVQIGTVEKYPRKSDAKRAAEPFRNRANAEHPQLPSTTFGMIVDEYISKEMPTRHSTRHAYLAYLENHIRPKWGELTIEQIKPPAVKEWLLSLDLAPKTRGHIKALMFRIFDAAMFFGHVDYQINPMKLIKLPGSSKRQKQPRSLSVQEIESLLATITEEPFRTMVLLDLCLGLRCSELLALKWCDVDWQQQCIHVTRAIVDGHVDRTKTEYSEKPVPLDDKLLELLRSWRRQTVFDQEEDWIFASPYSGGAKPYRSWGVQQRRIVPAAIKAGIGRIGWHTFRHTYRSFLGSTDAPLTVQRDLMRHASITTTMNLYGSAMPNDRREAHEKVVRMIIRDTKTDTENSKLLN